MRTALTWTTTESRLFSQYLHGYAARINLGFSLNMNGWHAWKYEMYKYEDVNVYRASSLPAGRANYGSWYGLWDHVDMVWT